MTKFQPQVSVVIPCYEQAHFLPRALDSLHNQGISLEAIVVDDGSPYPVSVETSRYSFPIRLLRQPNSGPAAARNAGLKASCGKFVKFLDADDALLKDCLASQVASLGDDLQTVSLIGFRLIYEDEGSTQDIVPAFADFLQALLLTNLGPPAIYLFPSELLRRHGGFYGGQRTFGGHEDYDLPLGLAASGVGVVTVHRIGAVYHKRHNSLSSNRVAMAGSRVAVWTHHLPRVLATDDANTLMTALVASWQLHQQTPARLRGPLQDVLPCLVTAIEQHGKRLEAGEVASLLTAMDGDTSPFSLTLATSMRSAITTGTSAIAYATPIHPLEIVDRRLTVPYAQWLLDNLPDMLVQLRELDPVPYAIYGAGEFGRRLERLLSAAGLPPRLFVDREAGLMEESIHSVPVVTLPDAAASGLRHFVVASLHHRQSIVAELEKRFHEEALIIPTIKRPNRPEGKPQ